uniref:Ribosomal eL28/Mak16 domain-containing protein n=1 Tax=Neobodo designis TaxID=312471 RepID=A0A7S1Q678_NEODS|mmetsp:Transcript_3175/g.9896  ORF Transcript_3175/g.9896 Transcript_3175/m.9896 type:complete len:147 (+) Transcript_3175:37-477(+)|eukprot:CAMPEP_0174826626 /NCGR_PEP_ID=MMETSP1114-20130205/42_1 /TAXON_ID=312471 /ORGANISM="Neobodo designis, Strain CCAP 1951/1" /LENGTH=146 /DNA_ID=CAMNT_0016060161 /DNA_START=38 /DNA_END=478 /DNA_ORIENTATION=-
MSADLLWQCVGRNNKYLQMRNGIRLSSDPFNNSGKATLRHAGFLQSKAAVVKVRGEKKLYVTLKTGDNANQPRKAFTKKEFDASAKASDVARAAGAVRPDLADIAFRRARKFGRIIARTKKVRAARAARSAKREFKRKNVRKAKKN